MRPTIRAGERKDIRATPVLWAANSIIVILEGLHSQPDHPHVMASYPSSLTSLQGGEGRNREELREAIGPGKEKEAKIDRQRETMAKAHFIHSADLPAVVPKGKVGP